MAPISSSKSMACEGPKITSPSLSGELYWPSGRAIGVPETTTEEALPPYPMG